MTVEPPQTAAQKTDENLEVPGRTAFLAGLGVALVLAVLPPAIYFLIELHRFGDFLTSEARAQARLATRFLGPSSAAGAAQRAALATVIGDVPHPDHSMRIVDAGGQAIVAVGPPQGEPTMLARQPVIHEGQRIAEVGVQASLLPTMRDTLLISAGSGLFGILIFFPLYRLYLASLRRSNAAIARSEARFRDLATISSDWVWERDADYRFCDMSSGLMRAGMSNAGTLGKKRWELPILLGEAEWAPHKAVLAARQAFSDFEYPIRDDAGYIRWFSISGRPVFDRDGRFTGYRGTGRDVTRAKEAEAALRDHRDHLQELVEARTADAIRAKDEAERANRAKSEFLSNMSHELRTPLHRILSCARLGADRIDTAGPERLREYFRLIHDSGSRLLVLLNDLLDLVKLEAGRMELRRAPFDLADLLASLVHELHAMFELKNLSIDLQTAGNGLINGDAERIGQVVRNLLANASKYAPPGSTVRVRMWPERIRDTLGDEVDGIHLAVEDQGPGIPEQELQRIFDKFVQSSNNSKNSGGTGLGLAICQEIVHLHCGMISASNRPEGGACFAVLLPPGMVQGDSGKE